MTAAPRPRDGFGGSTVCRRLVARLHPTGAYGAEWEPCPVEVSWSAAEPLALVLWLDGVEWAIGRDLVADGLDRSVGLGDVVVSPAPPAPTSTCSTRTSIRLRVDGCEAVLSLRTSSLRRVLDATYARVPAGSEDVTGDVDAELAALVGGTS